LGTHQGSVDEAHLQSYLHEFTFRFNRRGSNSRGMVFYRVLELAVGHEPVRYRDLVVDSKPKRTKPVPPRGGGNPPSLDRPRAARPWRTPDAMKERGLLPLPAAPPSVDAWECPSRVREGEEAPKWKRMQEYSLWESICTVAGR
jgi:hypothetical protein